MADLDLEMLSVVTLCPNAPMKMSSDEGIELEAILRAILQEFEQNTKDAPTVPGVYRLPCGSCHVDFFVSAEGEERWLVPGDDGPYTRENIAVARHGPTRGFGSTRSPRRRSSSNGLWWTEQRFPT